MNRDDPAIPLLTDRIYLPALDLDIALPASAPPPAETAVEPPVADAAVEAAAPIVSPQPRELTEQELAERTEALRIAVLDRVAAALPERVDATVRDLMQPAIDEVLQRLGEEARLALRIAMQELVEQAIRDELAGQSKPEPPPATDATP